MSRASVIGFAGLVACSLVTTGFAVYQRHLAAVLRGDLDMLRDNVAARHELKPSNFSVQLTGGSNAVVAVPEGSDSNVWAVGLAERDVRIAELEVALGERDAELADLRARVAVAEERRERRPPSRDRRRAWMEELKEKDPERYKQMVERRKAFTEHVKNSYAQKAVHLLERDTSGMTEAEAVQYERMLALIDENWKLTERMQEEDIPRDERGDIHRTMRDNMRELGPLLEDERAREFRELGAELGYSEDEAEEFSEYIGEVIEATSFQSMFRGPGPGGRGERSDRTSGASVVSTVR